MPMMLKALEVIGRNLAYLRNEAPTNPDYAAAAHYIKAAFLTQEGEVCRKISASEDMRQALAFAYNNNAISWKLWANPLKEDSVPNSWPNSSLSAWVVRAIINDTDIRTINMKKYLSAKLKTATNVRIIERATIREITVGDSERILLAQFHKHTKTTSVELNKDDWVVAGTIQNKHATATSGSNNTTYADIAMVNLSSYILIDK